MRFLLKKQNCLQITLRQFCSVRFRSTLYQCRTRKHFRNSVWPFSIAASKTYHLVHGFDKPSATVGNNIYIHNFPNQLCSVHETFGARLLCVGVPYPVWEIKPNTYRRKNRPSHCNPFRI